MPCVVSVTKHFWCRLQRMTQNFFLRPFVIVSDNESNYESGKYNDFAGLYVEIHINNPIWDGILTKQRVVYSYHN